MFLWNHVTTGIFVTPETDKRIDYYDPEYYPFCTVDGTLEVTYGILQNTATLKGHIDQRKALSASVNITIQTFCPATSGTAEITIKNTSSESITGTLQVLVKELGLVHSWSQFIVVDCAVRDMVPDENGEEVTIEAGQTITKTKAYSLDDQWIKDSCRVVAFIQKPDKEIVAGASVDVNTGMTIIENFKNRPVNSIQPITVHQSKMICVTLKEKHSVSITDAKGREVALYMPRSGVQYYSIPKNLATGMHVITVQTESGTYATKFLHTK